MIRIVGGRLSGRRLASPKGSQTRPTSERVREAMASILDARGAVVGASVLDLFSGTGALAFEMLSRGAARAVAVERDPSLLSEIAANAKRLDVDVRGVSTDLLTTPQKAIRSLSRYGPWSLVLVDPPYAEITAVEPLLGSLVDAGCILPEAYVVVEHARDQPPTLPPTLATVATYRYGDTGLILAMASSPSEDGHPRTAS